MLLCHNYYFSQYFLASSVRDKATLAKTESFHENVFRWVYLSYILSLQVYNLQRFESDLHHRYPLFTDTTVIQPLEFLYFILSKALGFKNQKHWKDSRKLFNDNHIKSIPSKAKGAKLKGKKGLQKSSKRLCKWSSPKQYCQPSVFTLISQLIPHFFPILHIYTPWKMIKLWGFLMFTWGIEMY